MIYLNANQESLYRALVGNMAWTVKRSLTLGQPRCSTPIIGMSSVRLAGTKSLGNINPAHLL